MSNSGAVAKKLQLTTPPNSVAAREAQSSGGRGILAEPIINGTVSGTNNVQHDDGEINKNSWENLFRGNRASDNGLVQTTTMDQISSNSLQQLGLIYPGIIGSAKGKTQTAQIFMLVYTEYVYAI
ncbi:uncharacterized protein LOC129880314 [Solanum dulcamara]|uniref:uncharacterized protein LOC129880314 n=1 Tax=Solanum dulcamara TaxID=45834 RepID=UPI00248674D1|nr:uncharacterized protein LOC129880314 [Solanum dulcamara]